jgi:hypothetical protein
MDGAVIIRGRTEAARSDRRIRSLGPCDIRTDPQGPLAFVDAGDLLYQPSPGTLAASAEGRARIWPRPRRVPKQRLSLKPQPACRSQETSAIAPPVEEGFCVQKPSDQLPEPRAANAGVQRASGK